ncbi:hypothetical protein C0993_000120 [Termitomyces sp. T159_Od127]|nr:hypothetical protein C0993_000120 [Termitomyces sp. T159_Od127]
MSSASSSKPPAGSAASNTVETDLDKLLSREESAFNREVEVERILKAFKLKYAESELSDKDKRENLDAVINQARLMILKALNLPSSTPDTDPNLRGLEPPYKVRLRLQSKELLIDEEVRRRKAIKMNLANEGLEARKKDEEIAAKKRKVQEDKQWEDNREQRVDSWRAFTKDTRKKKKAKVAVLG